MVVPELAMHGTTEVVSMTKTTEGPLLELNKTDKQNTTRERAKIVVDKDVEEREKMSCDSQQTDDHMQQQTQRMDGFECKVNQGCPQQTYTEEKMVRTRTT